MFLGCIADDFTGASDLANTLAKAGMATTQFVGIPARSASAGCEAGVISLKSRTISPPDAVQQSLAALDWLLAQGCSQIMFKYCSTFDSTPEGNIGPVAEALLERLGGMAIVCPVFPATGRTLFQGHLFVNGQLLSETGMRNHPLTPMTDPDIRRWLGHQTRGEVGLVPYHVVRAGSDAIRKALDSEAKAGRRLVVTDAVVDDDLVAIGAAIAGHRLVTGGSGIALGLAANFAKSRNGGAAETQFTGLGGAAVAMSGSCSVQSLAQLAVFAKTHPVLTLEADAVMAGQITIDQAFGWTMDHLGEMPMIASSIAPDHVAAAQARHGRVEMSEKLEGFMGALAARLVESGVARLVVGGGETSGAVVTALGLGEFVIGPEIDPGVPALASLTAQGKPLRLALKSGNFGALDFYEKAADILAKGAA